MRCYYCNSIFKDQQKVYNVKDVHTDVVIPACGRCKIKAENRMGKEQEK